MSEVIGVDFDGVQAKTLMHFPRWVDKKYGIKLSLDDIYAFDKDGFENDDAPDYDRYISEYANSYERFYPPEPLPGAVEVLGALVLKNEIITLTARPESERDIVEGIHEDHYKGIFGKVIMRADDQHFLKLDKGQLAVEHGVTILVDDHHVNIQSAEREGVLGILFGDYPWNRAYQSDHIHAVNWYEVHDIIGK